MDFFYNLNKRLADLSAKQDSTQINEGMAKRLPGLPITKKDVEKKFGGSIIKMAQAAKEAGFSDARIRQAMDDLKQGKNPNDVAEADYSAKKARAGKDIGKPGKMFSKIAKSAGERYGSKERGEKVAGAVLAKLRKGASEAIDPGLEEADMEEGNEFSGELAKAKATGAKQFKVDGKTYPVKEGAKPDYIDLDKDGNKKESMKKAAKDKKKSAGTAFDPEVAKGMFAHKDDSKYDVKDTGYSKRYTRKAEPEDAHDDEIKSDAPKKKGRPAGTKRAIGAKGPTGKSKLLKKDSIKETDSVALTDKGEYDQEGDMAKDQLHTLVKAAKELHGILADDQNLPEWVQSKITKALDYIKVSNDYMDQERHDTDDMVAEKAVSQQQQKFMGMVHAMQKGEKIKGASKELKKTAKEMPKKAAKDYAATKHAGLPKKVSETDDEPKASKKGGFEFGKGVYESLNTKFKQALTEGMNISVNMNTGSDGNPTKNITVSADGDDAEALAALLKMAGIGHKQEVCSACGSANCGCEEELDENSPDWPTNTETSDNAMQYSGGLNGPKSTGQTTVPVIASQLRRQVSMEESVELERSLFKLYSEIKAK